MEEFLSHIEIFVMTQNKDGVHDRIIEVGISWPNTLLRQGQDFAECHVQLESGHIQRWRLHSLPEKPIPVFDHPAGKNWI